MKLLHRFRSASRSLFGRLMRSFLAVIILLAAFNFFTFFYLKEKIFNEIVHYNALNMKHAIESYENNFRQIKTALVGLNQNEQWMVNLNILRNIKAKNGYDRIVEVESATKLLYTNPFLHLENVIFHFRNDAYVLEKEGTLSADDMFTKYYVSPAYPLSFWNRQFDEDEFFRVFPAAEFREKTVLTDKSKGLLLPVILKTTSYRDVYFIAMLDAQKLFQASYSNTGHPFFILDADGEALYSTSSAPLLEALPTLSQPSSYFEKNGYYFFYGKGAETGFTYISAVPIKSISSQLLKLNLVLLTLLLVTILISISTSVLFSLKLNHPVRKMLELMQQRRLEPDGLPPSQIREFDLIGDEMSHMMKVNRDIAQDLAKKTQLVRNYIYTNKLRNIPMNLSELTELVQTEKPVRFVLTRITFKSEGSGFDRSQAARFIKECIDCVWLESGRESVTFQIEKDLVLSLLFIEESQTDIRATLEQLKQMLDVDRELFFPTIAVSDVFPPSADFTQAYDSVCDLLKERKLNDEAQIIVSKRTSHAAIKSARLTALQEEEFHTRLMTGSEEAMLAWISRILADLNKKGAYIEQYLLFAAEVSDLLEKSLARFHPASPGEAQRPSLDRLNDFYSVEQYEEWFRQLLGPALRQIRLKSGDQDPVIQFVMEHLEANLHDDITLDLLADKLNLTPGYLSTLFKSKTGQNFSDTLNNLRVQHAKRMLRQPEYKIKDVAAQVGYQNVNSFIRMFKRYSGITPGEYRRINMQQPEEGTTGNLGIFR